MESHRAHILREWEQRRTQVQFRDHRINEWMRLYQNVKPRPGQTVVSCESNSLSIPIAQTIGEKGSFVCFEDSFKKARNLIAQGCRSELFNIEPVLLSRPVFASGELPLADDFADTIFSANPDPFQSLSRSTLEEFHRILKPGGRLVFPAIAPDTRSERFYRATQNKPRPLFSKEDWQSISARSGFRLSLWKVKDVPWIFAEQQEMLEYLIALHPTPFARVHILEAAKRYLGFQQFGSHTVLLWNSVFIGLEKTPE